MILAYGGFSVAAYVTIIIIVIIIAVSIFCSCRKYVPELKRFPVKYLFEPWKAPLKVQKQARCVIGDDYPEPVVDHIEQRRICVQRLKDLCISLDISGTS